MTVQNGSSFKIIPSCCNTDYCYIEPIESQTTSTDVAWKCEEGICGSKLFDDGSKMMRFVLKIILLAAIRVMLASPTVESRQSTGCGRGKVKRGIV
ncbi:hypothetical protein AVEN_213202-1 [Araneus ventricosus]|uniref:Uncharacterized protein n=1 Tax=Araneus ventricosus TaxID=182803 RepID=A0A4Y2U1M0_ARAVE|nr:hypothetical protein AVEN_213202-1 [Araneus ventricosus]